MMVPFPVPSLNDVTAELKRGWKSEITEPLDTEVENWVGGVKVVLPSVG